MLENGVLAERAKVYTGRLIFGFIFAAVLIAAGVLIVNFGGESKDTGWVFIVGGAFFAVVSLFYLPYLFLPKTLIEFKDGLIYLYPSNKRTVALEPINIKTISQKNYAKTRFNTQNEGLLNIVTDKETIKIEHVKDLESVRLKLELLQAEALQKEL